MDYHQGPPRADADRRSPFKPPRHVYASQNIGISDPFGDDQQHGYNSGLYQQQPHQSEPLQQTELTAEEKARLFMFGYQQQVHGPPPSHIGGSYHNSFNSFNSHNIQYNPIAGCGFNANGSDECSVLCLIQACLGSLVQAEHLQRALCFGAIDGMVTGSGIVAACAGLGLFHPHYTPLSQRLIVMAMCFAACASDGIGMSLGHIFSTYILHFRAARDREREEWMFDQYRNVSKAKLVDMLIQRGMLKIDAMSVADTLEGYPDVFISAIVGDSVGAGPLGLGDGGESSKRNDYAIPLPKPGSRPSVEGFLGMRQAQPVNHVTTNNGPPRSSLYKSVYEEELDEHEGGVCCDEDMSSGNSGDHAILSESRNEGLLTLVSFSAFSLLPGFIYGFLPTMMQLDFSDPDTQYSAESRSAGMSCASFAISLLSALILVLGIWKR